MPVITSKRASELNHLVTDMIETIKSNACCIENRMNDSYCTKEILLRDNRFYLKGCKKNGLPYLLIREDYLKEIDRLYFDIKKKHIFLK